MFLLYLLGMHDIYIQMTNYRLDNRLSAENEIIADK